MVRSENGLAFAGVSRRRVGSWQRAELRSSEPLSVMAIVIASPVPRKRRRDEVDESD